MRAALGSERVDLRSDRADLRPEVADLNPEEADLRPEGADLRPGEGRKDGETETENCPLWNHRSTSPKGNM